jgi:hypothetical protein
MYVAICTPSVGFMKARYTSSLMRTLVHYMHVPVLGQEKEPRFLSYHCIESSMVGQARETFVDDALANPKVTHLLFVDEDMGFREDCLNIMLARQMPFVACNYRMKVPPCEFTARTLDNKGRIQTKENSLSLEEALYVGFGFALIERRVLEAVKKPRFMNEWDDDMDGYSTEDRSFCMKAREAGFPPMIDHKASKRVYHMGNYNFSWEHDFPADRQIPMAERYNP